MSRSIRPSFVRVLAVAVALLIAAPAARADESGALYRQGMALKNQGKDDEAIAAFEKAVAENPKHGMAWASLGHLYKKKKEYDKSVAAYEHATEIITKCIGTRPLG